MFPLTCARFAICIISTMGKVEPRWLGTFWAEFKLSPRSSSHVKPVHLRRPVGQWRQCLPLRPSNRPHPMSAMGWQRSIERALHSFLLPAKSQTGCCTAAGRLGAHSHRCCALCECPLRYCLSKARFTPSATRMLPPNLFAMRVADPDALKMDVILSAKITQIASALENITFTTVPRMSN